MSDVPQRIVSRSMRRLAIVLWIVAAALIPIGLINRGPGAIWFVPGPTVFTAVFAWLVLWRPRIDLDASGITVVDVRRTTTMAWSRVLEVRSRYGVEIVSSEGIRRTWIAPTRRARLEIVGDRQIDVDEARALIDAQVPDHVEQDGPPPAVVAAAPITTRVHGWLIVLLVVLGVAASLTGARI